MQQKRGLGSFGGFHTRLCSLNLQMPKSFLAAARKTVVYILKQKSLATKNVVGIIFIIKIPVLKLDKNPIARVCLHYNYPIIVMLD